MQVDLVKDRKVDSDEASEYARSQGMPCTGWCALPCLISLIAAGLYYAETSAKADNNVEQLFVEVAKRVPKTSANVRKDVVNVKAAAPQAAAKKGCC